MKNLRIASFLLNTFASLILASPLIATRVQADALDNWSLTFTRSGTVGFNDAAYGNDRFVAVSDAYSDAATIYSSDNGYDWIVRAGNDPTNIFTSVVSVTYAQEKFVAVGFWGSILYSTNGMNWQQIPTVSPSQAVNVNLNGITYGDGKFVAVGDSQSVPGGGNTSSNIFVSTDGLYWQKCWSGQSPILPQPINSVAYGNHQFVALGEGGYYYTSTNGTNWTARTGIASSVKKISFGKGLFVAAYGSSNVLVSLPPQPSMNWATVNTGTGVEVKSISFINGMFIGGGYSPQLGTNYIITSVDGTNWTRSSSTTLDPIYGFASDGHRVVGVGRTVTNTNPDHVARSTVYLSDPVIDLGVGYLGASQLKLSGIIGRTYRLDNFDGPATNGSNSWQVLTNFTLPSSPYIWTDTSATNSPQRFYRAVLLP